MAKSCLRLQFQILISKGNWHVVPVCIPTEKRSPEAIKHIAMQFVQAKIFINEGNLRTIQICIPAESDSISEIKGIRRDIFGSGLRIAGHNSDHKYLTSCDLKRIRTNH